jgi:DHA2 family multidrug resistance protein
MNVPVGILALFLVNRLVTDPEHAKAKGLLSIDYVGLTLIVVGLGAMQVVLDKGQEDDWFDSRFILIFTLISVSALLAAIAWLLRQKDPVIDIRLMATRSFGMASLMIFFVGVTLYASSTMLPLLVQSEFGYDATTAGLVLSPGGFALIILMPVVGKLVNRFQAKHLIAFGMLTISIGMWMTSNLTPQIDYNTFVMMRVVQVLGLPFLFIPCSTMAFSGIPPEKGNKASALYSMLRNLGGSIGISLLMSYETRHQQIHQSILVEHLSPTHPAYTTMLAHYTQVFLNLGLSSAAAATKALSTIYEELQAQASILAYIDTFHLLAAITLLLSILALLMPGNLVQKKPSPVQQAAH